MATYSGEFKDQILKEITEVRNISLVCKKYNLRASTVHGWLYRIRNKNRMSEVKVNRELHKKIEIKKKRL